MAPSAANAQPEHDGPLSRQRGKFRPELRALRRREQLGIVDPSAPADGPAALEELPRDADRGRDHRARERAPPHLVHAEEVRHVLDLLEVEAAELAALHRVI